MRRLREPGPPKFMLTGYPGTGLYRLVAPSGYYSNIRRVGREWYADIRKPSGDLKRYAGIWRTRRDAVEEATSILERDCF